MNIHFTKQKQKGGKEERTTQRFIKSFRFIHRRKSKRNNQRIKVRVDDAKKSVSKIKIVVVHTLIKYKQVAMEQSEMGKTYKQQFIDLHQQMKRKPKK